MKHCPKCQRQLVDEAKFCMHCGTAMEEAPVKRFCINCGAEITGKFCAICGTPAAGAAPAAVTPAPEAVSLETAPTPVPKKKGKGWLVGAIIAIVLVLGLAVSWAFGLFGDGGLFGEGGMFASESEEDREDEVETKQIPIVAKHPTLGEVVDGYLEVEITDERDCVYRWEDGSVHDTPEETRTQSTEPAVIPVTITVWAPEYDQEWLCCMAENFAVNHPEFEITYVFETVSESDARSYMLSDVQGGADVYMYANDQVGELVEGGALAPITGGVLEQVQSGTPSAMLDSVTYGGDVYGIPYTSNTWFMYYDKSVFTESDIRSLEAMLQKGKVAFPLNNSWYFPAFYFANGCSMFGPGGNNPSAGFDFGGENAVAVTDYVVDLVKNPNFVVYEKPTGAEEFRNGSIHAFFSGAWEAEPIKEALGENFGAAQLPTITIDGETKQMRAFAGSKAIGVNPNADNLTAAYLFAMYLGSEEGQHLRYEMTGTIPVHTALEDTVVGDPVVTAQMNCIYHTATVQPSIPEMAGWWGPATDFANQIIYGDVTHKNAEAKTKEFNEILNNG